MKNWACLALLLSASVASANVVLESDAITVTINASGQVSGLMDKINQVQYAAPGQASPLLLIYRDGEFRSPETVAWDDEGKQIVLRYAETRVVVAMESKGTHITLEVVEVTAGEGIERVQWGPIATSIKTTVGEVIGVVRNESFAIGLQGLNVKTLGGPADSKEGRDASRGRAALRTSWGSTLQAYSLDRSSPRNVDVWGGQFPNMPVKPILDETVIGSKVALFGVAADSVLNRVGEIERAENLPHPMYQEKWALRPESARFP